MYDVLCIPYYVHVHVVEISMYRQLPILFPAVCSCTNECARFVGCARIITVASRRVCLARRTGTSLYERETGVGSLSRVRCTMYKVLQVYVVPCTCTEYDECVLWALRTSRLQTPICAIGRKCMTYISYVLLGLTSAVTVLYRSDERRAPQTPEAQVHMHPTGSFVPVPPHLPEQKGAPLPDHLANTPTHGEPSRRRAVARRTTSLNPTSSPPHSHFSRLEMP